MKTIEVVAAIIKFENRILCVQRGDNKLDYIAFKYEFPGGKVEDGESPDSALIREIKEELNLDITIENHFLTVDHSYPDFRIIMHSYLCACDNNNIVLSEHINSKWLLPNEMSELDWAAADIPIVNNLKND